MSTAKNIFVLLFISSILQGMNGGNNITQDEEQGFVIDSNVDFEEAVEGL